MSLDLPDPTSQFFSFLASTFDIIGSFPSQSKVAELIEVAGPREKKKFADPRCQRLLIY